MKKIHITRKSGGLLPPEGPLGFVTDVSCSYIGHGTLMRCPTCDAAGNYDEMLSGEFSNEPSFSRAIWYDEEHEFFQCFACYCM